MLCEKSPALYIDGLVIGSVNDEGGHPDRRDNIADIDLAVHAHERGSGGRAGAKPLEPAKPAHEGRIICPRGGKEGCKAAGTPGLIDVVENLGEKLLGLLD